MINHSQTNPVRDCSSVEKITTPAPKHSVGMQHDIQFYCLHSVRNAGRVVCVGCIFYRATIPNGICLLMINGFFSLLIHIYFWQHNRFVYSRVQLPCFSIKKITVSVFYIHILQVKNIFFCCFRPDHFCVVFCKLPLWAL